MKFSEIGLILLILFSVAGLSIVLFRDRSQPVEYSDTGVVQVQSEILNSVFEKIALGRAPRTRISVDTLIYTIDLDIQIYTLTQANLELTRAIRQSGYSLVATCILENGILAFHIIDPSGVPSRIEIKP